MTDKPATRRCLTGALLLGCLLLAGWSTTAAEVQPKPAARRYSILERGAIGDGRRLNTKAILNGKATSPPAEARPEATSAKPTLFLIGDSTVRNNTRGQMGWGTALGPLFDESKIVVANRALGGRSSRTFLTEGLWDKVLTRKARRARRRALRQTRRPPLRAQWPLLIPVSSPVAFL